MISRFKWYSVRLPCTVEEALDRLDAFKYHTGQEAGFVVDRAASSFEYYWRTPMYLNSIDEGGEAVRSEVFSLSRQKVELIKGRCLIFRIQDPPRSSKELFNMLEGTLGFGFGATALAVGDATIKQAIKGFNSVALNSIKFSGAISEASALARVEVASKRGLQMSLLDRFALDGRTVESASYSVMTKGISGQVGFTRSGICKISGDLAPLILSKVESCLLSHYRCD